jgi:predicted metalloprotease with PDZ domain
LPDGSAAGWWSTSRADVPGTRPRRAGPLPATDPIVYRICPADPHAHRFTVVLEIAEPDPDGQRLALPAWIPGSYMIREFARHVVSVSASRGARTVPLDKIDKHTWRAAAGRGPLRVEAVVYAWDLSVRAAHLDASHAFFNASCLCLRVLGQEHRPCTVDLQPPPAPHGRGWRVATTLPRAGARPHGFGRYRAPDYDALIDHPVEMGTFRLATFEAGGARHEVAVTGRSDVDLDRLVADLAPVCAAQSALFEPETGRAPFDRYLFLATALGEGYGGLEHRSSTALISGRADLPWPRMGEHAGYRTFLGLASHEYFHAWHVKRIKPAAFVRYDLDREVHTRLLWVFEGFTSYYDDLMLARAGVLTGADYLKLLARTVSLVQRAPGRRVQSVADSSFDAWIKYYRPDEHTPNAVVSYYAKGALVALAIDLAVRARTGGRRSLDDAMRLMWTRHGRGFYTRDGAAGPNPTGLPEDGFAPLLAEATGVRLDAELARWVDGTAELPLARLLAPFGVRLSFAPAPEATPSLGVRLAVRDPDLTVATAYVGEAGHRAGLSAGDVVVACDGLRVNEHGLKALLARRRAGDTVRLHVFRRDELLGFDVALDPPPPAEATLAAETRPNALRRGWLGGPTGARRRR